MNIIPIIFVFNESKKEINDNEEEAEDEDTIGFEEGAKSQMH